MAPIKILYVDDEEHNLKSFKATFRRQYEIYTAISASQAKDVLAQTKVHIIISDQRMPEITGVELFKSIKTLYPDPIRVLLTAYTDIDALADAVNEGHIYRYITKPWSELELNNCIINAYESYKNKVMLKEKVAELQKVNDELNRFIYSISHELRAPLSSALGIIYLAKIENVIEPETPAKEYWNLLEECCQRLDYNISSTLQYYRNKRYDVIYEKIDFDKLVHDLINIHKLANNKADQIEFNLHLNQSTDFYGDKFRIEIIIGNLISNAIKYQNPEESKQKIDITIKVSAVEAVVIVEDNGLGILQDHLAKIFSQFFRGKSKQGVGLGLFITREALEKINGTISVKSDVDKGSTFTLRIPNHNEV